MAGDIDAAVQPRQVTFLGTVPQHQERGHTVTAPDKDTQAKQIRSYDGLMAFIPVKEVLFGRSKCFAHHGKASDVQEARI